MATKKPKILIRAINVELPEPDMLAFAKRAKQLGKPTRVLASEVLLAESKRKD